MNENTSRRNARGYILEAVNVPNGFPARLEREGLAMMTAFTIDGVYLEPRVAFARILEAFEQAGAAVLGFRPAGAPASWHDTARPAAKSMDRLRNFRSAEWLPTIPAA